MGRCRWFFIIAQLFSPRNTPCCYSFLLSRTLTPATYGSSRFGVVKTNVPRQISTHYRSFGLSSNTNNSDNTRETDEAQRLRDKAERLRMEIEVLQNEKETAVGVERTRVEDKLEEKRSIRMRYSAEVPILKDSGETVIERVDFPPRHDGEGTSSIIALQAPLPLGLILGEDENIPGAIRIDEVVEGGSACDADVKVGDLLRAITACQMSMETPTWQLMMGGIGQPKTKRFMYSTDNKPFEEVMDAVGSNRMDPDGRPAWLVLERLQD